MLEVGPLALNGLHFICVIQRKQLSRRTENVLFGGPNWSPVLVFALSASLPVRAVRICILAETIFGRDPIPRRAGELLGLRARLALFRFPW